jgi:formyl-CoA transferase
VGPVYTVEETFQDPQVKARNMVVDIDDPRYGMVRQAGIAIKLSDTPGSIRRVGPAIGEHTTEVLTALGYSESQQQHLRQAGVVA